MSLICVQVRENVSGSFTLNKQHLSLLNLCLVICLKQYRFNNGFGHYKLKQLKKISQFRTPVFPGESLGSTLILLGMCPPASQNPSPIIVCFWSILWPIIDPILVTFEHYSLFLVYFVVNYKPHLSHFRANDFL